MSTEPRRQTIHTSGPPPYNEPIADPAPPDFPPPTYTPIPIYNESTVEVARDIPLIPHHVGEYRALNPGDIVLTSQEWQENKRRHNLAELHRHSLVKKVESQKTSIEDMKRRGARVAAHHLLLARQKKALHVELESRDALEAEMRREIEQLKERNKVLEEERETEPICNSMEVTGADRVGDGQGESIVGAA
jgi:hypothetical protein